MSRETERQIARQGRIVAVVIAVAMLLWLGAQILGPMLGLPGRYAFLFDFAALAAFVWAIVVSLQIWRKSRNNEG